jgi:SAM-dependent methyltransferase
MLFDPLQRRFRARRMALLASTVGLTRDTRVLDVGGTIDIWRLAPVMPRLVLLNMQRARYEVGGAEAVVLGDGTRLPFADQSFDLVFSNSVIEHVGSRAQQARFAAEIARVGKRFWVQTPNRYFPIEQHLWTPFLHWLPRASGEQHEYYVRHYLDSIRLLTASDLRALFPGATVRRERFLGWTKSLLAWGDAGAGHADSRDQGQPGLP